MGQSHSVYRTSEVKRRNYILYLLGAGLLVGSGIAYFMMTGDNTETTEVIMKEAVEDSVLPTINEPQLEWNNFTEPFLGIGGSFIDSINSAIDQSLNLLSDGNNTYISTSQGGFTSASGGSFI